MSDIKEPTLENIEPYTAILSPGDMLTLALLINIRDTLYRQEQRHEEMWREWKEYKSYD